MSRRKTAVVVQLPSLSLSESMTLLIAERMKIAGFKDVKASAPGFRQPGLIKGALRDHRPDVTARFNNNRPLFIDAYDPSQEADLTQSRWQLMSSLARKTGGSFQVVVPERVNEMSGENFVKSRARTFGINNIHKIWEV